jgi:hypothetical protein
MYVWRLYFLDKLSVNNKIDIFEVLNISQKTALGC